MAAAGIGPRSSLYDLFLSVIKYISRYSRGDLKIRGFTAGHVGKVYVLWGKPSVRENQVEIYFIVFKRFTSVFISNS